MLKSALGVVLLVSTVVMLVACSESANDVARLEHTAEARQITPLNTGWHFTLSEATPEGLLDGTFQPDTWQPVTVPHSWNRVGYYQHADDSSRHSPETVNTTMGTGYYHLTFSIPTGVSQPEHWLEFDAASRTAEVWLNGQRLGEHRGGFTRFRFNATDAIYTDKSNTLVVKVDNSKPTATSSTYDTLPIAGDFFVHGGLYREVRLVSVANTHIALDDFGGAGVYASTSMASDGAASITVTTLISQQGEQGADIIMVARLTDDNGEVAAKAEQTLSLEANSRSERHLTLKVVEPKLWQGMDNPYLYRLEVVLTDARGKLLDSVSQQYGLRTFAVDPNKGFILNGKPLRLKGVAYHQDREGRGWAVSRSDIAEDIQLLTEMGANTVRLAHYPHGQPVHELANELGLILWDEIPLVSVWRYAEEYEKANQALIDNAQLQLTEMIKQNYNHPSVAVWGIANEVDFGAVLPAFLGSPPDSEPDPTPILTLLDDQVAKLDPNRYSVLANCCEANTRWPADKVPETTGLSQTTGLNRYYGWYYGQPQDLDKHLDTLHALYPEQPLSVSEYGAGGATTLHTDDVLGGPVAATGRHQPEEYMSYVHEVNWSILASKPYLWATWIWNGFDFATTTRVEGDSIDINTKGLITYDRNIKKDSYYFYQANWSEQSMVHITSKRYADRAYQVTPVKVYSNLPEVELLVNNQSQGVQSGCVMNTCQWPNVKLAAGVNQIVARGTGDTSQVSDSSEWHLNPQQVNTYFIDSGALMAADSAPAQFGSDAFFSGGSAAILDKPGGWGRPAQPADIHGTTDRNVATTYRSGEFSYGLSVADGVYHVQLWVVAQSRALDFEVSGNQQKPVAVRMAAGDDTKGYTAEVIDLVTEVTDGRLELWFTPKGSPAAVSAIIVVPK